MGKLGGKPHLPRELQKRQVTCSWGQVPGTGSVRTSSRFSTLCGQERVWVPSPVGTADPQPPTIPGCAEDRDAVSTCGALLKPRTGPSTQYWDPGSQTYRAEPRSAPAVITDICH